MSPLLEELRSGRVLLMDGGMGTELQRAGLQPGGCGEEWNLTHPEQVLAIHRSYVSAGARVLLTNTFQANPESLRRRSMADRGDAIWAAGIDLARVALPGAGWVLADAGPFESREHFLDAKSLIKASLSADGFLLETLSHSRGPALSLHFWRDKLNAALPFLLSFTFLRTEGGKVLTIEGETPERCARTAYRLRADALGVNCGRELAMAEVTEIVRRYRDRLGDDLPIFARPNAGTPERVGDWWFYPQTPEMMADQLPKLIEAGVNMVGGCCGTSPAHIAAFRRVVDSWNNR